MGFDQAHEQNNKIVKADGGAIGILDKPVDFDEENDLNFHYHHEDIDTYKKKFREVSLRPNFSKQVPHERSSSIKKNSR